MSGRRIKVTGYITPEDDERDDGDHTGLTAEAYDYYAKLLEELEELSIEPE